MRTRPIFFAILILNFVFPGAFTSHAAGPPVVQLPKPQLEGGKPLMQALKERMTIRSFSADKIPEQKLSNLLWAAFGINRPDGRRTAPSAKNWQEIDIYVATTDGLYLYDAKSNALNQILAKDIRAMTGLQAYVKEAPVNLIYVADYSKTDQGRADKDLIAGADTGVIVQNVYLYCASEGLATVIRANIDRDSLAREMKLKPEQKITLSQSVGYPKK
ncbi:MAG: nitroreductase family protein [Syntrophobacteraceae bacterium]